MNSKKNISGLLFYTCFKLLSSIFSKGIYRQRKKREKRDAKESRERECVPEPANLRQPAPRVLASHPQKQSRRVYFSRLGFRSSSGNFRLPPVRFREDFGAARIG
ncbi:hypothetical protein HanIR_Chr06g0281001 [Helianthus annuus]|nr:hypothetical protein HanIR_Chr06g0281001 [Helianthus annuus]